MKYSKAEMQDDLANTESDIQALSNIVGNLDIFMTRTGGEDRSAFKMDRLKYAALLARAHSLKDKIQFALFDADQPKGSCPLLCVETNNAGRRSTAVTNDDL